MTRPIFDLANDLTSPALVANGAYIYEECRHRFRWLRRHPRVHGVWLETANLLDADTITLRWNADGVLEIVGPDEVQP